MRNPFLWFLSLLLLIGVACDTFPADKLVGVSGSVGGQTLVVRYGDCRGGVALVRVTQQKPHGDDFSTLWEVRAVKPVTVDAFTVGVAPDGFTDVVPFAGTIDPSRPLNASVKSGRGFTSTVTFRMSELRGPDHVLVSSAHYHQRYLTTSDFATRATKAC